MGNSVDIRDLRPGQRVHVRPGEIATVTKPTTDMGNGIAVVHTDTGMSITTLPCTARLA